MSVMETPDPLSKAAFKMAACSAGVLPVRFIGIGANAELLFWVVDDGVGVGDGVGVLVPVPGV